MIKWFALGLLAALSPSSEPPAGIYTCIEFQGGPIRSNWTYQPDTRSFLARWPNGNQATLKVEIFEEQHIVVTRCDASGPTAGLRVRYEGLRQGAGYTGSVLWCWQDQAQRGNWTLQLPAEGV